MTTTDPPRHPSQWPPCPKWELGGTYEAAFNGCHYFADIPSDDEGFTHFSRELAQDITNAHVATLDLRQFQALPSMRDELLDYEPDLHLPFDPLYVSVDERYLAGVLLTTDTETHEHLLLVPFWLFRFDNAPNIAIPMMVLSATSHIYKDMADAFIKALPRNDDPDRSLTDIQHSSVLVNLMDSAMRVVRFLESANVEVGPAQTTRQIRRHAERKGRPIALQVQVRAPRATRRRLVTGGEVTAHREFDHRFEVAGHYLHFGSDTRLFKATERDRPHKIINHPTRGRIVRIWQPPHVKGPEDRPLVPKTRRYGGSSKCR